MITNYCKSNFYDWLKRKGVDLDEFVKMHSEKKEVILLRWKYGSEMDDMNKELEWTQRMFNSKITEEDISKMKAESKEFWESDRKFENRCEQIRREVGILKAKPQGIVTKVVEELQVSWSD